MSDKNVCLYASEFVFVRMKNCSFRLCIDFRRLNAQTIKDAYKLPRIEDIWSILACARYFYAFDLLMGYHEVEVETVDRVKTVLLLIAAFLCLKCYSFRLSECAGDNPTSNSLCYLAV